MIAARPTTYKGIKMRSRLEATWAAHLDNDGFRWEYEPRAYANANGQYLPDFQVFPRPEWDVRKPIPCFQEIRPTLDGAYRAMEQMPVIWDSEPDAILFIVVPDLDIYWVSNPRVPSDTHGSWRLVRGVW